MARTVWCPRCGKAAALGPADGRAERLLCVACGAPFDADATSGFDDSDDGADAAVWADDAAAATSEPVPAAADPDPLAAAVAVAGTRTAEARRTPRPGGGPTTGAVAWAAGATILMLLAVIAVALAVGRRTARPDLAARPRVIQALPDAPQRSASPERRASRLPPVEPPATGPSTVPVAVGEATPAPVTPPAAPAEPSTETERAASPAVVMTEPPPAVPPADPPVIPPPASPTPAPHEAETEPADPPAEPAPSARPTPAPPPPAAESPVPQRRAVVRRPPPAATKIPTPGGIDDEQIEAAIRKGIAHLAAQFDGRSKTLGNDAGYNALAVYALLQAGLAVDDERLSARGALASKLLDRVARSEPSRVSETYTRAVRALCLALYNRPSDRRVLQADVEALVDGHKAGAYGYQTTNRPDRTDNSNSQFGVLGVWAGADAGVRVPPHYWKQIEQYWINCQRPDGGWTYNRTDGMGQGGTGGFTMTSAGVASLFVARDFLAAEERDDSVGKPAFPIPLAQGLAWFDKPTSTMSNGIMTDVPYWGYANYGVERIGLASGFKHLGGGDWYRGIAKTLVKSQQADGGWGGVVDTSFDLLFLSRGRHPILFNKLKFDGSWSNRPRDLAGLTPWVSRQLERPLNWQVVEVDAPWEDWLESPVLYIASHLPPRFTKAHVEKLRRYAQAGGLIFVHTDGGRASFDEYVVRLARELFPEYEFADVPADHPLYSTVFKLTPKQVPLRAISNGSRLLLVHTKHEMATRWQWRDQEKSPDPFRFAANLHVYAAGKRDLRRRLQSPYVPEFNGPRGADAPALATIDVARVQYAGNWDPEPAAWTRFARLAGFRTGTRARVRPVKWADLSAGAAPLAHVTGTARYRPTAQEVAAMRAYVEAGGVLLVDNCGPGRAFTDGLADALRDAFGRAPAAIPAGHPLVRAGAPGMADLAPPSLRRYAAELLKADAPLPDVLYAGKGTLLVSKLDVGSGLLGTATWGIMGYAPKWSEAFVQNLLFWMLDGQPTVAPGRG